MVTEFQNRGFLVTALEVQTKVHEFTQRFRKEQQCVGVSGGAPSDWKYFHILKRFLGNLPIHNTTNLVFESIANQGPSSNDTSLLSPCSSLPIDPISTSEDSETPAKKINKGNLKFQNLIDVENHIELQERTDARFLNLMEESNVALSRIAPSIERGFPYTRLTGYDDSSDDSR